jgi:hypothetical protein
MKTRYRRLAAGLPALLALTLAGGWAIAEENRVTFPANLDSLVHYTTVKRGNVTEHMLTSQAALDAVRKGQPMPSGTHVVLVDYRDSKVFRYFVMEKREGWGADFDPRGARVTGSSSTSRRTKPST